MHAHGIAGLELGTGNNDWRREDSSGGDCNEEASVRLAQVAKAIDFNDYVILH